MMEHGGMCPSSCTWDMDKPGSEPQRQDPWGWGSRQDAEPPLKYKGQSAQQETPWSFAVPRCAPCSPPLCPHQQHTARSQEGGGGKWPSGPCPKSSCHPSHSITSFSEFSVESSQATPPLKSVHLVLLHPGTPESCLGCHLPAL